MKGIFAVLLIMFGSAVSACENDRLEFLADISTKTMDAAYEAESDLGTIFLKASDKIIVRDKNTQHITVFHKGRVSTDGAGNFEFESSVEENFKGSIFVSYDHETWHDEGIIGQFISSDKKVFDLDGVNCDYNDLFF